MTLSVPFSVTLSVPLSVTLSVTFSLSLLLIRRSRPQDSHSERMVLVHVTNEIVDGILDVHGDYLKTARKLNLSSNGIRYIDDLTKLNSYLTKLDLSFNDLEEVKGLKSLTLLEELNLSGNRLTDVTDIQHMTSLQYLDLSQNKISRLKDIQLLSRLQHLKTLNLAGNPLCNSALLYPYAILAAFPLLEMLDDRFILN